MNGRQKKDTKQPTKQPFDQILNNLKVLKKKRKNSGKVYKININKLKNFLIDKNYYETLEEYEEKCYTYHKIGAEIEKVEKTVCKIDFDEENIVC